jgi:hypothetical protein
MNCINHARMSLKMYRTQTQIETQANTTEQLLDPSPPNVLVDVKLNVCVSVVFSGFPEAQDLKLPYSDTF